MLQILLIRPGETEYDEQGRIQGTLDIPLSEDGRREAEEVVAAVQSEPIAAIYRSPCDAAAHVANALGEAVELKPKAIDNLHNLDHGLWQGMLVSDVKAKQPKIYKRWQEEPFSICPPEGETLTDAKTRIAEVMTRLVKKHKEGLVAVVVPEPLASVFRHVLRLDGLGDLWNSAMDGNTPAWERIDVVESGQQAASSRR